MIKHLLNSLVMLLFLAGCSAPPPLEKPPLAEVKPVEDVYYGRTVSDPYRYMEDLENPQVKEWFENQSAYARQVLDNIPRRKFLIDKMKEFDERKSTVIYNTEITDDDRYVYLKQMPEDESGKLFYRDGFEGEEHLLYDPETYDPESERNWVLTSFSASNDGSKVVIELAPDGSESAVLKIMDIENGTFYPEEIDRVWFAGASWLPDGKSFLYNRLKSADVHQMDREKDSKTFVHVLGQDPSKDKEYFSREMYPELEIKEEEFPICIYDKESKMVFGLAVTVDRHLRVFYSDGKEAGNDRLEWKLLFDKKDEVLDFEPASEGVYIYSSKDAPNFQILKTGWDNPSIENAEVVVSEPENAIVDDFSVTKNGLYYVLSIHGVTAELYHLPKGKTEATRIKLPSSAGSINLMSKGPRFEDFWVTIYGWSTNWARYKYVYDEKQFKREQLSTQAEYPEYTDLVVEELMIPSHDGVRVPLSLIYMKGLDKKGKTPIFISGYGAYGVSSSPFFSPEFLLWTLEGGIHAIAHVRGGGELGDEWHMAGFKQTKKNTWKDVIACAEYLIESGYTSPENIAVNSASAGGIFVGRSMTERPDLFAAAIPEVGVMNTLRGENSPNGPVNAPEFGTVKDSVECMALIEMDSYLNIKDGVEYPASLVTAGMNDPRVIAWQPAKFAARLQSANASEKPILFWCDMVSGHGIGDTKTKGFEKQADVFSFAFWNTGHPGYQPR
jgi:prolyl oligopeptidase